MSVTSSLFPCSRHFQYSGLLLHILSVLLVHADGCAFSRQARAVWYACRLASLVLFVLPPRTQLCAFSGMFLTIQRMRHLFSRASLPPSIHFLATRNKRFLLIRAWTTVSNDRPCAADEAEAAEASDALRQPSSDIFINAVATCDSSPPPCSEGSWCLDGDLGVYCQRYPLVMSSEEVRSTGLECFTF